MENRDWLSNKQRQDIRNEVLNHPKIKELQNKIQSQLAAGRTMQALMMQNELNDKIEKIIVLREKEVAREVVDVDKLVSKMSKENFNNMNESIHAILILCDMMEYFTSEIDQAIESVRPGFRMNIFDSVKELCKESCKMRMFIEKRSIEALPYVMADEMDKTTALIRNKAKALIRATEKKTNKKSKDL